jgi:hypothetical protein
VQVTCQKRRAAGKIRNPLIKMGGAVKRLGVTV